MIARRLIVGALLLSAAVAGHAEPADVLLYNGKVLTIDERFSIQTTLAVRDGRILAVGGEELREKFQAPLSIDLKGRVLLPGFNDTHIHVQSRAKRAIDVAKARSVADVQKMLREKAAELGPGQWITGFGWDETQLAEQRNLVRSDLDPVTPKNPVVLTRAGGHSAVGNSLALKIAKIDKSTPDPANGLIERDSAGEANGIIRERNDLYTRNVPQEKWEDLRAGYVKTLQSLFALGITSIIEASGSIDDEPVGQGGVKNPRPGLTFRRLQELVKDHDLPRTTLYISYPGAERLRAYPHHTGYGDEKVRIGAIGESAVDGGFTGPTAWTLVDYKGLPGFRGKGRFTDAQLQDMVDTAAELGWQMGLHAIGDAAIVQTVDAYSKSIRAIVGQQKDHRWFLDHFTIMPPDATMRKMAADSIRIAQQPNFLYNLEGRYKSTLDDWRLRHNNPVGTPAKQYGLFVAFGSDNLPISPFVGLYAAVTRRGPSGAVYGPEEAVTMPEALRMYTANGAFLTFEEKLKGTLEPGKLADMIVLDADPLTMDAERLLSTHVDLTILGGKVVYDRSRATP
jgi:predicted amidohydrolase YtcJ